MVAAAQTQRDFPMEPEKRILDDLRARVARLEREVQSRDSYIDGLILRNRGLRIDFYKHQAEVLRLRRVLRQAGLSDAANESATRIAVASSVLDPEVEPPPSTQPQGAAKRTARGDE